MKNYTLFMFFLLLHLSSLDGQTNFISTNPAAEQVMLGNYNPFSYQASEVITQPDSISRGINESVSPDSLHQFLTEMKLYQNRNSGSDTLSQNKGIGAARKWAFRKFQQFSATSQNRLLPSYLQFDMAICGMNQHKNIFAVLPGSDTSDKSVILIEGHFDSRCAGLCDTACLAEGMEDNGSGSALVMELARVMSKYTYKRTIVFLLTIAEEQGLYGAEAFAMYCQQKGIKIRAVLNNDVIGGIICGKTSSLPSCPGEGNIDSTHVRLFSYGGFNSPHKQLARFVKLEYLEMIQPVATVSTTIQIMSSEDRTGRSGDHIPFRSRNYAAIRFTAANENGNANVTAFNYTDRQHTSGDVLGADTNNDNVIDSFYVDFNYLSRNAVINGNAAAMASAGPASPDFSLSSDGNDLIVDITQQTQYNTYRVALRTTSNDWDSVYSVSGGTSFTLNLQNKNYIASVASVDTNGVESLFSKELTVTIDGLNETGGKKTGVELMQNKPNPADEITIISVLVNRNLTYKNAWISVRDISSNEVTRIPIRLGDGINEVEFNHGYHATGTYIYSLVIDGEVIQSRRMVFAN
jgi:hypothetical protein